MACRMILVHLPNRIPGVTYVARLRVVGSFNMPAEGSIYYKTTIDGIVRFEGVPDNYYEVGISMINSVGAETTPEWQPVASYEIGKPVISVGSITGNGFQVTFTAVAGATGYEYSIDYGPWQSLGTVTPIVVSGKSAGQVVQVAVRAVIAGRRGYASETSAITTPSDGSPIFTINKIKTEKQGGLVTYDVLRIVVANALKSVGQTYTLTNGFTVGSKEVQVGDTYESIAAALVANLELKAQTNAATYSFVDFRDYSNAGKPDSTSSTFAVS